jgi:tRNA pseudouridine55 synthase
MTSLVRTGIEGLSLGNACTIEEMEAGKDPSIDPLSVIDPAWKIVECRMPEMVMQGKHVYLNDETSDKVIFVKDHALLAAYEKQEDGMYHCKRGLF